MEQKERATVMLRRRGTHEDRLRQAMVDGLVRKEIQQDIEATLAEAERTRRYAEHMEAQAQIAKENERAAREAMGLRDWQIAEMQRDAWWKTEQFQNAERVFAMEQKKAQVKAEKRQKRKEAAVVLISVFVFLVAANVMGRWIFDLLSR